MAYSDLIRDDFQNYLSDNPISFQKNFNAEVSNLSIYKSGSLPMIEDFLSGRLDICILTIPEKSDFPVLDDEKLVKIPLAYKSSVVVVNKDNPVSELTLDQLSELFGVSSTNSNLLNWRNFGISSFSTSMIKAYAVKEDRGISSDLFRYAALNSTAFGANVQFDQIDEVERMIVQDKTAIGIFPRVPINPNLKTLFVAKNDESIAYGPSIDNIYYSDYIIRLPFYIVYNVMDTKRLYPLISTLLSDSVAEILEANDFFPLPKVIREKYIIDAQLYLQKIEE
jgi:ABC-type phosphate transport system substrate-binding protein